MQAGSLNSRITIQRQVSTPDAIGQPIKSWATLATVWANVRVQSGAAAIRAGGEVTVAKASVRIRRRSDVTAGMRVLDGTTTYEVEAVLPATARQDFTDLVCKAVA